MIVLLGHTGYVGQAFEHALQRQGVPSVSVSRAKLDYSRFDVLLNFLREQKPAFLINAAGFTGRPNVDACETAIADTLQGNTLLPVTIAHACTAAGIPWGHISSGCIYTGAKILENEQIRYERDLSRPEIKALCREHPERVRGFTEEDDPNFTFRNQPCSFYSGTKAMAEEALRRIGSGYIWRLRIPFDEIDHPRNFLTKLQRYRKVYDNVNSLSHRGDFAQACLELWRRRAPFGTYNVTNPGFISAADVVRLIQQFLKPNREFEFWRSDDEFYKIAARAPRSNCVLDVSKLLGTGVSMRPVEEALTDSLRNWKSAGMT